jgi:DNA replication protein DnaC
MTEFDTLRDRAETLHLHGLVSHWPEVATEAWVATLLEWEETQRACRSLERRLRTAHIGRFKPLCDFDRNRPKHCDRAVVDALMAVDFLDATNVVLVGPNGVGKSSLALNSAHQALVVPHRHVPTAMSPQTDPAGTEQDDVKNLGATTGRFSQRVSSDPHTHSCDTS